MGRILLLTGVLVLIFSIFITTSKAVKCYQCAYIKGINDRDLNPDCVSNPASHSVSLEEGAACVKAEGRTGGNWFVLRLAYRPGYQLISLPAGQQSSTCLVANVNVTRIGERRIDTFDSCDVCNDKEACNKSHFMSINIFFFMATLTSTFLCHWV